MSLAEFALPSTESRDKQVKKDEFNEIKILINRIQRERRKNESSSRKDNQNILDTNSRGDDFEHVTSHQDLEHLFKIVSHRSDESSSLSTTHNDREEDKQTGKRVRPRTTNSVCSSTIATNSLQWSSHASHAQGLELFHISPVVASVIKDHETPSSPPHTRQSNRKQTTHKHMLVSRMSTTSPFENLDQRIAESKRLLQRHRSSMISKLMEKTVKRPLLHSSNVVSNMLHNQQRNRQLSFEIRNQRIDDAKAKRSRFRDDEFNRIEETLSLKEQHRLDHLTLKRKEIRQSILITTIKLVAAIHLWFRDTPAIIAEFRYMKSLNDAARIIQHKWKKEMFLRRAMEARIIRKKLKKFTLKLHIWSRCARRRLNAQIIRQFFVDFSLTTLPFLIFKFRTRVIKSQKMIKSFVECKYARITSLELSWVEIEKELVATGTILTNKQKKRKNALSDFTHQKIIMRGVDQQGMEGKNTAFTSPIMDMFQRRNSLNVLMKELLPNRDPHLCRDLCRFHLEDSRRTHMKRSGVKFVRQRSSINRNHAVKLLTGQELNLTTTPFVRMWPIFSLLSNEKDRLKSTIKDFHRDEVVVKGKTIERLKQESLLHRANHFASAIQSPFDSNKDFIGEDNEVYDQSILTELRVIFQLIDVNGDGKINDEELRKIRYVLGFEDDTSNQVDNTCTLEPYEFDFKSFITELNNCSRRIDRSEETVLCAFQYFSKGSMDQINCKSLSSIMQSFTGKWSKEQASATMRNAGFSKSKIINYKQFVSTMYSIWTCKNASELFNL